MSYWKLKLWTQSLNIHLACIFPVAKSLAGNVCWLEEYINALALMALLLLWKTNNVALPQREALLGLWRKLSLFFPFLWTCRKTYFPKPVYRLEASRVGWKGRDARILKQLDPSQEKVGRNAAWPSGQPLPWERSEWPTEPTWWGISVFIINLFFKPKSWRLSNNSLERKQKIRVQDNTTKNSQKCIEMRFRPQHQHIR